MKHFTLAELKAAKREVKSLHPRGGRLDLGDGFYVEFCLIFSSRTSTYPIKDLFSLKNDSQFPNNQGRYTLTLELRSLDRFSAPTINRIISSCTQGGQSA